MSLLLYAELQKQAGIGSFASALFRRGLQNQFSRGVGRRFASAAESMGSRALNIAGVGARNAPLKQRISMMFANRGSKFYPMKPGIPDWDAWRASRYVAIPPRKVIGWVGPPPAAPMAGTRQMTKSIMDKARAGAAVRPAPSPMHAARRAGLATRAAGQKVRGLLQYAAPAGSTRRAMSYGMLPMAAYFGIDQAMQSGIPADAAAYDPSKRYGSSGMMPQSSGNAFVPFLFPGAQDEY